MCRLLQVNLVLQLEALRSRFILTDEDEIYTIISPPLTWHGKPSLRSWYVGCLNDFLIDLTDLSRAEGPYMYKLPYPFPYAFALSWDALPDPDADHAYHKTPSSYEPSNEAETHDAGTHTTKVGVGVLISSNILYPLRTELMCTISIVSRN